MSWFDNILDVFRDSRYVAFSTFVVSVTALVLSVITYISNRRLGHREMEFNQRLIEIEEGRDKVAATRSKTAQLTAQIVQEPSLKGTGTQYFLDIKNIGEGTARNIVLLLDSKPAAEHPTWFERSEFNVLGGNSTKRFPLAPTLQTPVPSQVRIDWKDDRGENSYESSV